MKVALYGNVCNNFYALAKCLRNNNIAEAHLYLHNKVDMQNRPESDDPYLTNNYPEWIHMDRKWDPFLYLKKFDKSFIRELNQYDVVFLSDYGPILAPEIKCKTIFYTTGGDLTRIPFVSRNMEGLKGYKTWFLKRYISYMQRRGIKSCNMIITQPFKPFRSALRDLHISEQKISKSYYPILMDVKGIPCNENAMEEIDPCNRAKLSQFNFIIFHPSRLMITKYPSYVATGHWKGNDNLFKAFSIFLKEYNVTDACIAMPERMHSPEIELAKSIIRNLDIENNIVWLKPTTEEGFPRNELMKYYSLSDLVADEFATGWFGSIVIEGTASGKPTFCHVDETVMKQLYPWHPIVSAIDSSMIAEKIAQYYFDKNAAVEKGKISREWALQFHSLEQGSKIYAENLKKDLKEILK